MCWGAGNPEASPATFVAHYGRCIAQSEQRGHDGTSPNSSLCSRQGRHPVRPQIRSSVLVLHTGRKMTLSPLSPPRTPKPLWDLLSSVALSRLLPDIRPYLTTLKHNGSINSATAGSLAPRQGTSSFMCSGNSQSSSRYIRSRGMPAARISSKASCRSGSVTISVPNSPW